MALKNRMRQTVFVSDNAEKLYEDIKNKHELKIDELKANISKIQGLKQQEIDKIQAKIEEEIKKMQAKLEKAIARIQALQKEEIKKIELKYQKEIEKIRTEHQRQTDATRLKYQEDNKKMYNEWDKQIKEAEQALSDSDGLWSSALKDSDIVRVTVPQEGTLLGPADIFVTQTELENPDSLNPKQIRQKHAHSRLAVESLLKNIKHIKKSDPRTGKLVERLDKLKTKESALNIER